MQLFFKIHSYRQSVFSYKLVLEKNIFLNSIIWIKDIDKKKKLKLMFLCFHYINLGKNCHFA